MANLAQMLKDLKDERARVAKEMNRLDMAISALGKLSGKSSGPGRPRGRAAALKLKPRKRRKMTAATRRKIAAAQKARWARVRKEKAA